MSEPLDSYGLRTYPAPRFGVKATAHRRHRETVTWEKAPNESPGNFRYETAPRKPKNTERVTTTAWVAPVFGGGSRYGPDWRAWGLTPQGALNRLRRKICRDQKRKARAKARRDRLSITDTFNPKCGCPK